MNFKSSKKLLFIFSFFFLFFSCESSKTLNKNNISKISMELTTLGNSSHFVITKDNTLATFSVKGASNSEKRTIKRTTISKNWNKIIQLINDLNLNEMENWSAPSQQFLYDGARATVITLTINGQNYHSLPFDEGNPPSELNELYTVLETILNELTEN